MGYRVHVGACRIASRMDLNGANVEELGYSLEFERELLVGLLGELLLPGVCAEDEERVFKELYKSNGSLVSINCAPEAVKEFKLVLYLCGTALAMHFIRQHACDGSTYLLTARRPGSILQSRCYFSMHCNSPSQSSFADMKAVHFARRTSPLKHVLTRG